MDFKKWLNQFKDDNSPIGDLAMDVTMDKNFPSGNNHKSILAYLQTLPPDSKRAEVFEKAWELYSM